MKDRRKHKRWFLSKYFEAYREDRSDSPGYLADISMGGLMLMGKFPVQTNIVMPLRISLNKEVSIDGDLQVITQVVRCGKDTNFDYYSTGCKLIDLSTDNKEVIERLIEIYGIE